MREVMRRLDCRLRAAPLDQRSPAVQVYKSRRSQIKHPKVTAIWRRWRWIMPRRNAVHDDQKRT